MKPPFERPKPLPGGPVRRFAPPPCKHKYVFIETEFTTLDNGHTMTLDRFYCEKCLDIVEK